MCSCSLAAVADHSVQRSLQSGGAVVITTMMLHYLYFLSCETRRVSKPTKYSMLQSIQWQRFILSGKVSCTSALTTYSVTMSLYTPTPTCFGQDWYITPVGKHERCLHIDGACWMDYVWVSEWIVRVEVAKAAEPVEKSFFFSLFCRPFEAEVQYKIDILHIYIQLLTTLKNIWPIWQ